MMENVNTEEPQRAKAKQMTEISRTDCNPAATGDVTSSSNPAPTVNEPFHPYASLAAFIDTIPPQRQKENDPVPAFMPSTLYSDWMKKFEEAVLMIARCPLRYEGPLRFFKDSEIRLAKENDREIVLGVGELGSVFLGIGQDEKLLAIKFFKILKQRPGSEIEVILREAAIQDRLGWIGVAPAFEGFAFIESNTKFHDLSLISRFIYAKPGAQKGITLKTVWREDKARRKNGNIPLLLTHQYHALLLQITQHLNKLEHSQIVHTDIKFDNIILQISEDGQDLKTYLIDFGCSFRVGQLKNPRFRFADNTRAERFLRRYKQYAPELLFDPQTACIKTDLYSLGNIVRDISVFLEIPMLVCVAHRLRSRNIADRPGCRQLVEMIQRAFGKKVDAAEIDQLLHFTLPPVRVCPSQSLNNQILLSMESSSEFSQSTSYEGSDSKTDSKTATGDLTNLMMSLTGEAKIEETPSCSAHTHHQHHIDNLRSKSAEPVTMLYKMVLIDSLKLNETATEKKTETGQGVKHTIEPNFAAKEQPINDDKPTTKDILITIEKSATNEMSETTNNPAVQHTACVKDTTADEKDHASVKARHTNGANFSRHRKHHRFSRVSRLLQCARKQKHHTPPD